MKKYTAILSALAFLCIVGLTGCSGNAPATPSLNHTGKLYDTTEIILTDTQVWHANDRFNNPFFSVKITATVTKPDGETVEAIGFFDGDGKGGNSGNQFKIRVYTDQAGTWQWQSHSQLSQFAGLSGTFEVNDAPIHGFDHGAVIVNSSQQQFFRYQNGDPVYLVGKFLDHGTTPPQYTHTWFSEKLSDADREQMFARQLKLGVNKINVYIANKGDYKHLSTTPWLGSADKPNYQRFDLAKWHLMDKWVRKFRDTGIVAHVWMLADDSNFGNLTDRELAHLAEYTMARLSPFVNTMFITSLEWQESFTAKRIERLGEVFQDNNPWNRLVSTHGVDHTTEYSGDFDFPHARWANYMDVQPGFTDAKTIYDIGARNRLLAYKPLIVEEFSFGEETREELIKTWSAIMTGSAGIGTGHGTENVQKVLDFIDYFYLSPAKKLNVTSDLKILSFGKIAYFAFSLEQALINFTWLPDYNPAPWDLFWVNLETGETQSGVMERNSAGELIATPPDQQVYGLYIKRKGRSPRG